MTRVLCSLIGVCAILAGGVAAGDEQPADAARPVLAALQPQPISPSDIVNPPAQKPAQKPTQGSVQKPVQKPTQKPVQKGCCGGSRGGRLLGRR